MGSGSVTSSSTTSPSATRVVRCVTTWPDSSTSPACSRALASARLMPATIDTNLAQTTLDADTAHALFDLTADSPGVVQLGSMDGTQTHRRFGYVFKTLSFGGVTLHDPHIMMVPNLLGSKSSETIQADSRIQRRTEDRLASMRIGMDILRTLHLYIATKEQKLYLTLAPPPAGRAGAPAQ